MDNSKPVPTWTVLVKIRGSQTITKRNGYRKGRDCREEGVGLKV